MSTKRTKTSESTESTNLLTVGTYGHRVSVHVRPDRKNRIYFQWPRSGRSASGSRGGYHKLASNLEYGSRERKETKEKASVRATAISAALRAGAPSEVLQALALGEQPAPPAVVEPSPIPVDPMPTSAPAPVVVPTTPPLPLRVMFRRSIGPSPRGVCEPRARDARMTFWAENPPSKGGIYKTWTQQAKTARQLADTIEDILGADTDLMSLTENEVSSLWTPGIADNALKRVSVLLRVSRWAQRQFRNTHGYRALTLEQGWQKTVSEACRSADEEIAHEQRYTVPELGRIWRLLMDPDTPIHPAIRYATLLGGEQRLGQVLATTIRNVTRVQSAWLVKPPQQPKKLTAWIALGTGQVEWFQALYEAALQRPDGRLFPLSRGRAAKAWKKLETLADAQHFGWYGMRRAMIDLCDNARTDLLKNTDDPLDVSGDVVLDTISAHMPGGKRDAIYRNLPVGNRKAPLQPSGMWDILACATRVKLRARELAMERADSPL